MNRRSFLQALAVATLLPPHLTGQTTSPPTTAPAPLTRSIPSTGELLPCVGLGTWQTFDESTDDADAMRRLAEVLRVLHAGGGRVVDSSPMYGRSEAVVGHLSTQLNLNDDFFLATKVWTRGQATGERQMRDSLQKLRRDKLQLMQIHNLVDWQAHLRTLRAWKDNGTFRYIGITHYQPSAFDEMERIIRAEKLDFIQFPYSVNQRDAEKRLLPAARDLGVAVIINEPFDSGRLFATVKDKPLPDLVRPWANTWAQAFLKFILAHESVTCVIPGTSKPHHMQDNLQAATHPLPTPTDRAALLEACTT